MTMRRFVPLVWAALAAACAGSTHARVAPPPTEFLRSIETESEKAVGVVIDPRFGEHVATVVEVRGIAAGMRGSGLFSEEDVAVLAAPVAAELARMRPEEKVRITAWADGFAEEQLRRHFLYIAGGQLHVVYFQGRVEMDHHRATLPGPSIGAPIAGSKADAGGAGDGGSATAERSIAPVATVARLTEEQARRQLLELQSLVERGLISRDEYRRKRKETLNRL